MEIFQHIMQFTYWNISEHRGQTTRVQDASNIAYDLILHCIKIQTLKYSLYDYSYQDFIKSVSILKMGKIIFFPVYSRTNRVEEGLSITITETDITIHVCGVVDIQRLVGTI